MRASTGTIAPRTLALVAGLLTAVAGCSPAAESQKAGRAWLKTTPAPLYASPSREKQRKRPGLLSGDDGGFTLYRRSNRGAAEPSKPEKVRR
jgi:hypothetical protein